MIQIARLEFNGEVTKCKIHDLVRDLATQKAKEHKLLVTFDSSKQDTNVITLLQGQPRHAIYNGIGEYMKFLGPNSDDLKLRSLSLINETNRLFKVEEMKLVYTKFTYLKVLDFMCVISDGIPEEIGNLVLLTFLGLMKSGTWGDILVIPATIRKLKKLQMLYGFGQYEIPIEIGELKELRHLNIDTSGGGINIGSYQTKLQSVEGIKIGEWIRIDTAVKFPNLRILYIQDDKEIVGFTLDSIANLTRLQELNLQFKFNVIPSIKPISSCKRLKTVFLSGKIKDTSELILLPNSVTCLTLRFSGFKQDPMPILGTLSNLTSLHLRGVYDGEKMVCKHDAFPNLQFFRLTYFFKLEELQVEDGAMPSLKGFDIDDCDESKMICPQLQHVPAIPDIIQVYF